MQTRSTGFRLLCCYFFCGSVFSLHSLVRVSELVVRPLGIQNVGVICTTTSAALILLWLVVEVSGRVSGCGRGGACDLGDALCSCLVGLTGWQPEQDGEAINVKM